MLLSSAPCWDAKKQRRMRSDFARKTDSCGKKSKEEKSANEKWEKG